MHDPVTAGARTRPPLRRLAALVAALTGCALILSPAAIATARVSISTQRIVITAPRARAVITRSPLRIAIEQCAGQAALSEVANRLPGPQVLAPTADPIAPGVDNAHVAALYAPLSFTVGREDLQQYDGGIWGGDP